MTGADASIGRSFRRAALVGSLVSLLVCAGLLLGPDGSLVADGGLLGGFFDAQGRAFLGGSLAVPPSSVGFEGFVTDGATYEYFGPVLAILRLPVLAVTHGLDQKLTQLSMLLALGVLLAATAVLHWRVREWLRPGVDLSGAERVLVGVLQVAVGAGSIALYLVARPVVYHETELWGAALAIASLCAAVGVLVRPSRRGVALLVVLGVLTINTRVSVGLIPVLAMVVVGLAHLRHRRLVAVLAVGIFVLLGSSAAVNQAKFGQPFGIPIDRQVASQIDPGRKAALAANDGTIFGRQFVPSTALAALRPDAAGTSRAFPFVGLPAATPKVIGDVRFDTLQRSLSAPTSMALLCLLTLLALVGAVRLPARERWPVLGFLVAALGGYAGVLTIGYVTSRYLADALPLLVLGAAVGTQFIGRRLGRAAVAVAVVLVGVGVAVNGGAGLLEQRLTGSTVTERQRASWVRTQDRVDDALGRRPHGLTTAALLPRANDRRVGDLAIVGRCDGLFVIDAFGNWAPVERTERTGRLILDVTGGRPAEGAVAVVGTGAARVTLVARRTGDMLRFALRTAGRDQPLGAQVAAVSPVRLELSFEAGLGGVGLAVARSAGRDLAAVGIPRVPRDKVRLRPDVKDPELPPFSGEVELKQLQTPVCDRLLRRAR